MNREDADLDLREEMMGEDVRRSLGVLALLAARKQASGRLDAAEKQAEHAHDVAHRALALAEKNQSDVSDLTAAARGSLSELRSEVLTAGMMAMAACLGVYILGQVLHNHSDALENLTEELRALRAKVSP